MIIKVLHAFFLAGTFFLCTTVDSLAGPGEPLDWFHWAAGSYQSDIYSSGELLKGTTTLEINHLGDLAGNYSFEEKDTMVEGILFPCTARSAPPRISCVWADKYGTGKLEIQFEDGFKSFYGSWQTDGQPDKFE